MIYNYSPMVTLLLLLLLRHRLLWCLLLINKSNSNFYYYYFNLNFYYSYGRASETMIRTPVLVFKEKSFATSVMHLKPSIHARKQLRGGSLLLEKLEIQSNLRTQNNSQSNQTIQIFH